jgi:sialate O-acetylesterase
VAGIFLSSLLDLRVKTGSMFTIASLLFAGANHISVAPFHLPALFTDHMVLQRGKPISIWGWDEPGKEVEIRFGKSVTKTITGSDGKFLAKLPKMREGGPYTLTVAGSQTREIQDILIGEVWVCSGQSNMEWVVYNTLDRLQAQSEADPNIRMFTVQKRISQTPEMDVNGSWVISSSNTVDNFSAVGYAFAKKIYRELKVPIGMIHTSWGGTPAEAWMSDTYIARSEITKPIADRAQATRSQVQVSAKDYERLMSEWERKAYPAYFDESVMDWTSSSFDDSSWESVEMPHKFPDNFDGEYFYRRTVNLTADQAKNSSILSLGPIDDVDLTYINGVKVGSTTMTVPNFWSVPRNYTVPAGVLKEGVNVVAVRAYDHQAGGGFFGSKDAIRLGNVDIAGSWKAKQGAIHVAPDPKKVGAQPSMNSGTNSPNFPATLYNGMLAPLAPYSIRGAIWYQGESNAGRAVQYTDLLSNMIANWRDDFKQGNFPFYIAQLANYMNPSTTQYDSAWAELRDAQDKVGQMKNCGTATIIDIGEVNDIHPRNKRDVGERLARIALKKDYRKNLEWQGPRFQKASTAGNEITVQLSHANGLITTDGKPARGFAICGSDKKWQWANAVILGNRVTLSHPDIPSPIAVRYAWQDNPLVNLVNSDGLPAMPFRTDSYPLTTLFNL